MNWSTNILFCRRNDCEYCSDGRNIMYILFMHIATLLIYCCVENKVFLNPESFMGELCVVGYQFSRKITVRYWECIKVDPYSCHVAFRPDCDSSYIHPSQATFMVISAVAGTKLYNWSQWCLVNLIAWPIFGNKDMVGAPCPGDIAIDILNLSHGHTDRGSNLPYTTITRCWEEHACEESVSNFDSLAYS